MGRARPRSAFIKPACGISPSICKAISLMRIGEADKRNSNRDLRPRPNFHSKHWSQKPPKPPDSLPRLDATAQASASLLPDALTPLSPLGPAISGASPVGGMRDGENPENNRLGSCFPKWREIAFSSCERHSADVCKSLFFTSCAFSRLLIGFAVFSHNRCGQKICGYARRMKIPFPETLHSSLHPQSSISFL